MRIDLNADLGESFGAYRYGDDRAVMRSITSASIAAGFHAGDPSILRATVRLAKQHHVAVGAHPGLPDRGGFGRREMRITPAEAEDLVLYQLAAVAGVAAADGVTLQHVKLHGALYHMASQDRQLAAAVVRAVASFDPSIMVFGPPQSALLEAALAAGLRAVVEAFADRAYLADYSLAPRSQPGAVLEDPAFVVQRAMGLVTDHALVALDGTRLAIAPDTLCVHGDTPGAALLAEHLRRGLEQSGVSVRAVGDN